MPFPAQGSPDSPGTPGSPDSAEAAAFTDALHHIADGLTPADRHALTSAGYARGRSLRRRRTAMVTAGAAVLALAGGGGLLAATAADGPGHTTASRTGVAAPGFPSDAQLTAAATQAPPSFTARQMENLLVSLLPHGKVSGREGRGTDDDAPYAQVVLDDGHGPAAISVTVQRHGGLPGCGGARGAGDYCRQSAVAGGTLVIWKGYEYPDHRSGTKEWMAEFQRKDGALVSLTEWNAPAEKGTSVTRANPPLSTARLAAIATDSVWSKVLAATPPGLK